MGSFANTLFMIMLGWIQTAVSAIWSAFTTENGGAFLQWIGRKWVILAAILCVTGMALDLGVYLLRWRPMQVWRSFFRRLRHGKEKSEETEQTKAEPTPVGRLFTHEAENVQAAETRPMTAATEQEDLSRWMVKEPEQTPEAEVVQKKTLITGAGYTVPADSPYRRPAEPSKNVVPAEPPQEDYQNEDPEIRPGIMTQRKRRRRLNVGNLFADPEEELYQYEAPQQLIDKNKAYHQPVYPRNWNRNEEK